MNEVSDCIPPSVAVSVRDASAKPISVLQSRIPALITADYVCFVVRQTKSSSRLCTFATNILLHSLQRLD
jgi:hypothetical protein